MRKINVLIISLIATFLISLNVLGQEKKIEIAVAGGYSINAPKIKDKNTNNLKGYHVGALLSYNFNELVGIQTGALYNYGSGVSIGKGQLNLKRSIGTWKQTKTVFSAIDIPLKVVYSYMLAEEFYLQLFAGPNFNIGLNKQDNIEHYYKNDKRKTDEGVNIYTTDDYSNFDVQLGAGIGVQWLGFGLRGGLDFGLLNRNKIKDASYKANDIKITLSYKF